MASKEILNLTSATRRRLAASARAAQTPQDIWLYERQQQLERQLTVNAEIRQRWGKVDFIEVRQAQAAKDGAMFSDNFSDDSSPFKARFKVLIAAAETSVNYALAYIVSVLGLTQPKAPPTLVGVASVVFQSDDHARYRSRY